MSMEYELINPSDPYTFIADDLEVAALAVFALGNMFGAKAKSDDTKVPVFLFSDPHEWFFENFNHSIEDGLESRKIAVANALGTFMLGTFEDRRRYEAALQTITDPDKKESFKAEWQDGRSSMNDIGSYAHNLSKVILERS